MEKHWIVGITGASGVIYGVKLCKALLNLGYPIHLIITDAGWRVLHEELGWQTTRRQAVLDEHLGQYSVPYKYYPIQDIGALIASGSYKTEGMVIVPCSMGTLAAIANGMSDNLMERAADVMLKEGRKLIMVPRETPLHTIHLKNMITLTQMGVRMVPAMPAFYNQPTSLDDMISFVVGKALDSMGIDHELYRRWGAVDKQDGKPNSHRTN